MTRAQITWLGHAAFHLVNNEGKVALIDPFLTQSPSCPECFKQIDQLDLILLTHAHFDHVGDTIALANRFRCPVVAAVELCYLLEPDLPRAATRPMNIGGSQTIAGFHVTMTLALHSSSYTINEQNVYAGTAAGYVIGTSGSATFYHTGDTDIFSDMSLVATLWQPRIVALPIGGHYTMGPRAAALAVELLQQPPCVIPMHYGTWPQLPGTASDFESELALRGIRQTRVLRLQPGQPQPWTLAPCC